ncbi:MAG TPA: helix-turn-helix transcriptional regulator [Bryobacteraceae bacterium]|jgi:DNA-binding transcriptional ArsR family regulator
MVDEPDIAVTAALFGDRVRAAMLIALLDRSALSAGQLALAANVSAQTASFHLAKLTAGSLLVSSRRGRNHLYRLAGPAVARALESLGALSTANLDQQQHPPDRFRSERMRQLRAARTCYDHLAGIAGVLVHDSLLKLGYLKSNGPKAYILTAKGQRWFSEQGGDAELIERRSPFARPCMDWTEQTPHLAGRLAAFMLDEFFRNGWIARVRDSRAVRITDRGRRALEQHYGVNFKNIPSLS